MPERNRAQTRMQAREEEDEEKLTAAQPSSHISPAMRIYRHALESICGMLELDDLSRILAVSRSWSAAVRSMAPLHATIERDEYQLRRKARAFRPLPPIAGIPLLRHLAVIHISHEGESWTPLNSESLGLLAQHAPNLTSLWCTLTLAPNQPLVLPAKLASLTLQLRDKYTDAVINGVLTTGCTSVAVSPRPLLLRFPACHFRRSKHPWGLSIADPARCRKHRGVGSKAQQRPSGTDPFVSRTSAARHPRADGDGQARASSAAACHCALEGHRILGWRRAHWTIAP